MKKNIDSPKTRRSGAASLEHYDDARPLAVATYGKDYATGVLRDCIHISRYCPDKPPFDLPPEDEIDPENMPASLLENYGEKRLAVIGWSMLSAIKRGRFDGLLNLMRVRYSSQFQKIARGEDTEPRDPEMVALILLKGKQLEEAEENPRRIIPLSEPQIRVHLGENLALTDTDITKDPKQLRKKATVAGVIVSRAGRPRRNAK